MLLSKKITSLLSFAILAVFALSVAVVPMAGAAPGSGGISPDDIEIKKDSDTPYVDLITQTKKAEAGRLQDASTKEALRMLQGCNEKIREKNDGAINLADWSSCLNNQLKAKVAQCKELTDKRQKATCNLAAHKFKAAATRASNKLKEHTKKVAGNPELKNPKTYRACMQRLADKNNVKSLQGYVAKLAENRTAKLSTLEKKAQKIQDETVRKLVLDGISADKKLIRENIALAKKAEKPSQLTTLYCDTMFKTQVNAYRAKQVAALIALERGIKADTSANKLFSSPSNLPNHPSISKNALKTKIDSRLAAARDTMNATSGTLAMQKALFNTVQSARVTQTPNGYTNGLHNVDINSALSQLKTARTQAWRNYNEAQVLKKVQNDYSTDKQSKLKVVSITLQNQNGDTIQRDGTVAVEAAKDKKVPNKPRKASVKVTVGNQEYTTKLTKDGDAKAWRVIRSQN